MTQPTGSDKSSHSLLLFFGVAAAFVVAVASGMPTFDRVPPDKFTTLETRLH